MKAIVLEEYGGIEVLKDKEIQTPKPAKEELLINVKATALNRADILQRKGFYPGPPAQHEIPGLEFAGTVSASGNGAALYQKGDPVMGIVAGGAYAEFLTVHEKQVIPIPQNISFTEAAGIPEAWFTAYDALIDKGNLVTGDTCLIHAGASGVGTAAIQIAKSIGAEVATTASTKKIDTCLQLGADLAIDYTKGDFVKEILEWTNNQGANVIIDLVGGEYLAKNLQSVSSQGRIIQVGLMGLGKPEIDLGILLRKRISLIGTVLRTRSQKEKIELTKKITDFVIPKFTTGEFRILIDSIKQFSEIGDAHTRMERNQNIGKIIVEIS